MEGMNEPPAADALLVIDVQNNLVEEPGAIPDAAGFLFRLELLLRAARVAGVPIIYLQNDGAIGATDEPGSKGWQIHASVAPIEEEIVVRKSHDDGFEGTTLDELLHSADVRRMAVAGLLSEMCVSATIRGAKARGYEVLLVRDAHATYDLAEIDHMVVSRVAEHALGDEVDVVDASDVAFRPASPRPNLK
jgi:nicotinamidase-related amidase